MNSCTRQALWIFAGVAAGGGAGACDWADSGAALQREMSSNVEAKAAEKKLVRDGEWILRAGQGSGVEKDGWKAMGVGPLRPIVLRAGERRLVLMNAPTFTQEDDAQS
jgi:hypothetical protein